MRNILVLLTAAALCGSMAVSAPAAERYRQRQSVAISPDLSAPWVVQLDKKTGRKVLRKARRDDGLGNPAAVQVQPTARRTRPAGTGIFSLFQVEVRPGEQEAPRRRVARRTLDTVTVMPQDSVRTAALFAPQKKEVQPQIDPIYLPQQVDYDGVGKPGDIVIDSNDKFLYLVQADGKARRYGVGVGKEGFGWTGTEVIREKKVWPEWRPPAEMIVREREKGRILPTLMDGGPANPLGARAMYLGDTLYRIHGTNAPWTIGTNVSSGCIRLRNEDVVDLYDRVQVGTKVIVM